MRKDRCKGKKIERNEEIVKRQGLGTRVRKAGGNKQMKNNVAENNRLRMKKGMKED